jgi:MFS family permease
MASIILPATFFVLFLLEKISFQELGLYIAFVSAIHALLDYPTGALGDWIGHKWVFVSAYMFYSIGVILLLLADSFTEFLVYGLMAGIANSQESGALEAWRDNNYRRTSGDFDADRKIYGAFMGKTGIIVNIIFATIILLSGFIAASFSRRFLFILQFLLFCFCIILSLALLTGKENTDHSERTFRNYLAALGGGLKFTLSNRGVMVLVLGLMIISAMLGIWMNLMVFPFYESYSGTDEYVALLRATLFSVSILWQLVSVKVSRMMDEPYWGLFISFFSFPLFFFVLFLYYENVPPEHRFLLGPYLGLMAIYQLFAVWGGLRGILLGRLMVDLIPDENRNAFYSLQATLSILLSIPVIIAGGYIIESFGFSAGFVTMIFGTLIGSIIIGLGLYWIQQDSRRRMIISATPETSN